jgi:hypothetical protein
VFSKDVKALLQAALDPEENSRRSFIVYPAISATGTALLRVYYQPKNEVTQGPPRWIMTVVVASNDSEVPAMSIQALNETRSFFVIPTGQVMHFALIKSNGNILLFYTVNHLGVARGDRTYTMGREDQSEVTYLVWVLDSNARLVGCQ